VSVSQKTDLSVAKMRAVSAQTRSHTSPTSSREHQARASPDPGVFDLSGPATATQLADDLEHLPEAVRDRTLAEARGNRLALLEAAPRMGALELAGRFGLSRPHALPGRTEGCLTAAAGSLPAKTRRLSLLAAAEPIGEQVLLCPSAELLGI
jgi:hypothetical protein